MEFKQQSFGESLGVILKLYFRNIKPILAGGTATLVLSIALYWLIQTAAAYLGISITLLRDVLKNNDLNAQSYLVKILMFFLNSSYSIFLLSLYDNDYKDQANTIYPADILNTLKKRFFPLLWCNILVYMGMFGGILLLIIPGIIFSLAWMISPAFVVLENKKALESMSISWKISKGSRWELLGLSIIITLISGVVVFALDKALDFLFIYAQIHLDLSVIIYQWQQISLSIFISTPVSTAFLLVVYYNLKIKQQGLPMEQLEKDFHKEESTDA